MFTKKNNLKIFLITLFTTFVNSQKYLTEPPKYLKGGCQIYKPDFTKCSTNSIQGFFEQLSIGLPAAGLDTIDPYKLNKVNINQGSSETINIKVELSKLKIYGFAKTIVKENRISQKDFSLKTTMLLPKMDIVGDYALQGRILLIPLNGRGKISLNLSSMNIKIHAKTRLHEKGDFTFFNVTSVKVDYSLNGLIVNLTNLFNGNKELEDSTNLLFNENWQTLEEALRPVITQTVEDIMLDLLRRIFDYVPANFFVTDIPTSEKLYGKKIN